MDTAREEILGNKAIKQYPPEVYTSSTALPLARTMQAGAIVGALTALSLGERLGWKQSLKTPKKPSPSIGISHPRQHVAPSLVNNQAPSLLPGRKREFPHSFTVMGTPWSPPGVVS